MTFENPALKFKRRRQNGQNEFVRFFSSFKFVDSPNDEI